LGVSKGAELLTSGPLHRHPSPASTAFPARRPSSMPWCSASDWWPSGQGKEAGPTTPASPEKRGRLADIDRVEHLNCCRKPKREHLTLPIAARCCTTTTVQVAACCYDSAAAMHSKKLQSNQSAHRTKGQVAPPQDGELGKIEVGFLVPLVLATNIIVAIVVWYAVESLLR
jgi:hypothetical protein